MCIFFNKLVSCQTKFSLFFVKSDILHRTIKHTPQLTLTTKYFLSFFAQILNCSIVDPFLWIWDYV